MAVAKPVEAGLLIVGLVLWWPTTVRAELNLTATGSAGIGITDNAGAATTGSAGAQRSELWVASGSLGGTWNGQTQSHSLRYNASFARTLGPYGRDTQTHGLSWSGTYTPSARLTLLGSISASYGRLSAINVVAPTPPSSGAPTDVVDAVIPVNPSAATPISSTTAFITETAHVTATWRPNPIVAWSASTSAHTARPLGGIQSRTAYGLDEVIAHDRAFGLDSLIANVQLGYLAAAELRDSLGNVIYPESQTLHGRALIGWHRNLTPSISGSLSVGGLGATDLAGGPIVIGPSWRATATYTQEFASIAADVDRAAVPSLYTGSLSVSDRVGVNLALPIDRERRFHALASGGYNHARFVGASNQFARSSDVLSATAGITFRPLLWPVSFALHYTRMQQISNSSNSALPLPNIETQALMFTVTGTWSRYPAGGEGP